MKAEEIIDLIDKYWKFDNNQQHASNWHDKQDLLELFRKSTTQPQPTMSAEDFIKSHFKDIEIKTEWFPALVAVADGYSKYVSRINQLK